MEVTGFAAVSLKERHPELVLFTRHDPIRELKMDQARQILRVDPASIYTEVECIGWTDGDGSGHARYKVEDFFSNGVYLGADAHGIEPVFAPIHPGSKQ